MNRHFKFGVVAVGFSLLVASGVSAQSTQQDTCFNKNGTWNDAEQKCEFITGVQVSAVYPLELVGKGVAETTIDTYLQHTQQTFEESYTPDYSLPSFLNNWSMNISYELYHFSDDVVSIKFTNDYYTGGAHPNHDFTTFTFDLADDRQIYLQDLFVEGSDPWKVIAPIVQQDLEEHLAEVFGTALSDDDKNIITIGAGENPDNYQNFALTSDSLIFFFPPYQVAAYAAGAQEVSIPLDQLSDILKPEYLSE